MNAAPLRSYDRSEIGRILPHKPPLLLPDLAYDIEPGLEGKGYLDADPSHWAFQGHFPGNPIMPGVVITEALAQLSAVVYVSEFLVDSLDECAGKVGYLARIDMKFHAPVRPPVRLQLHTRMVRKIGSLFRFQVKASVEGATVADGTINVSENPSTNLE